jgi:hypothetical protein
MGLKLLALMSFFAFAGNAIAYAQTGDVFNAVTAVAFLVSMAFWFWADLKRTRDAR